MTKLARLGAKLPTLQTKVATLPKPEPSYGQGRGGRPWRRLKQQVHVRDEWTCQSCHRVSMYLECDHVINKAQGGTNELSNLQSLCKECHDTKTQQESKAGMG